MKFKRRDIIEWGIFLGVIGLFWFTGWHRPVMAQAQRAILSTGIIKPEINNAKQPLATKLQMELIDESGKRVNLADFNGKVVFLNVWATWCPPCRAEMPGIEKVYKDVKGKGIEFVMVSTDRNFALAIQYKKDNGYTFPIYRQASAFPDALNGNSIPRTYVLDKAGNIQMEQLGMAQFDTNDFRNFLIGLK